ncbi:ENHANCER OF AG-4 protein 2-like [Dorcoceras hygrometricum]|uniref:ENHANCER OF AG-4 protein 2-like n=1 Tax=Dorcoceras hygrometricum TaxID=472368 RepID=A0A2Z7BVM8_9LAMI|nr:ENHANCER OF AG-4 protein 2-like [Dorcoceras hygrometricum]
MFGCMRPVREDVCQEIVLYNLGVERIPADFLSMIAQGMACHSFVDSVVQRDSGDTQEVNIKDVEEVDLVSSDGSTVYRSPSPSFQEVDSVEHDLQFALGPAIFPSVAQEERLYYVQSPESSPAISLHQESFSSSTDVSMYFDSADIPVNAQADTQPSAPVDFTVLTDALEDLRLSLSQRIHDSNCEILSKITSVEFSVREDLVKQNDLIRQSLQNSCRDHETQGFTQVMHINDLKKGMLAQVGPVFQDLMDIKRSQREQDATITALDYQVAAIRNEQLDFQSKIAADILSLSTQFGDIVDYIRGGDAKNGEGSSSRPPHSLPGSSSRPLQPPPTDQIRDSGHFANLEELEEAVERLREADRRCLASYLSGTCAWLQPVFQEPDASPRSLLVEFSVREDLVKQNDLIRQSLQNSCRDHETQGFTQVMHINDLKKGMLAQVGPVFQDLMDIKRSQREQDATITALDYQVAAIRNEQLDFQSKIAADILSLSTQFGDIVDYIRGGDAKNGEGSSSRPPHSLPGSSSRPLQPPPTDQIRDSGHFANLEELEEAVERLREAV